MVFNALKILGKTVEFITVDGENHFISDYDKRIKWHNSITVSYTHLDVYKRQKYTLYNNKASLGAESADGIRILQQQLHNIGYEISFSRGDFKTVDS